MAPTEGASKRTPYHLRRDLVAFNAWTLNYAISELLVAYYNVDRPHLVILDRGSFDSLAWMGLLKNKNKLKENEYSIIKDFALHPKWSSLVSTVYLFTCKPIVSIEREYQSKLTQLPGSAMNDDMLTSLLEEYNTLKNILKDHPLIPIDTTKDTTPQQIAFKIASNILETFEKKSE